MSTETVPAQLTLPLGLTIPDVREDCARRLASLLRDIYWFHERGLRPSKNAVWAKRYKISERTVQHLLALLKEYGLIDVEIEHGTDRWIIPKFTKEDVALKWRCFAGYAWRMLDSVCRAIIKARRIKRAAPQQEKSSLAGATKKASVEKNTPVKSEVLSPELAPSLQSNLHPHPIEGTERKRISNNTTLDTETPRLSHAESAAVDALKAQGVQSYAAEMLVRSLGAPPSTTIARLLAWREKHGLGYTNSVTAFACWFGPRWVARKAELPAAFANEIQVKIYASDLGKRPDPRITRMPEDMRKAEAARARPPVVSDVEAALGHLTEAARIALIEECVQLALAENNKVHQKKRREAIQNHRERHPDVRKQLRIKLGIGSA